MLVTCWGCPTLSLSNHPHRKHLSLISQVTSDVLPAHCRIDGAHENHANKVSTQLCYLTAWKEMIGLYIY